ncbi:MAG: hypothetical protein QOH06_1553 [Acidobacteriota bacterium]|jgi:predicted acylesterase/phospholipase RssA|nr:hypothetical protein [Acidobacteriota bacterium]
MANIERSCDLVMKGGITSGVVYPKLVEEVAKRFHLVGIAGTSAGAIAASLAAAAEYRRRMTGSFDGFTEVGKLAQEIGGKGKLLSLFTPDKATRKLFKLLLKIGKKGIGIFTGLRLVWTFLVRREKNLGLLRDNFFGLCTGMANGNRGRRVEPLTEWLSRKIDEIAGKKGGEPLTFRDLHGAPVPEALRALMGEGLERSIDYRAVTTCVTFGRPFELPFTTNRFAFDPKEWRKLFPGYVVDFMEKKARDIPAPTLIREGKLPLPVDDLPVIVATRMSLSFPFLLTMVPLWAVDFRKKVPDPKNRPLDKVWFSDGGITSNFPIHRFDSIYPRWPTLGVTLADTGKSGQPDHPGMNDPETPEDMRLIYMPKRQSDGMLDRWSRFAGESATGDLLGFVIGIFNSAQNWHDNSFMKMPGYRDRSVEIFMKHGEGGLSLDMAPEVIKALAARGERAGKAISERFAADAPQEAMSWDGHRWTRFRSGMAGLFESLVELRRSAKAPPMAGGRSLQTLLGNNEELPTHKYETDAQRESDRWALEKLLAFLDEAAAKEPMPFEEGPRPAADFGSRAPF